MAVIRVLEVSRSGNKTNCLPTANKPQRVKLINRNLMGISGKKLTASTFAERKQLINHASSMFAMLERIRKEGFHLPLISLKRQKPPPTSV